MLKPTNSAAEQIVSLRSVNGDIDTQIASLQAAQARNLETITAFEEIATWVEVADETPVAVEEVATPVVEPLVVPAEPLADVVIVEENPAVGPAPTPEIPSDAEPAPVPVVDEPVQAAPRTAAKKKK
jgi:hypothetical protein